MEPVLLEDMERHELIALVHSLRTNANDMAKSRAADNKSDMNTIKKYEKALSRVLR